MSETTEYREFMYDYEKLLAIGKQNQEIDYSLGWTIREWMNYHGKSDGVVRSWCQKLEASGQMERVPGARTSGNSNAPTDAYRLRNGWVAKSPDEVKRAEGR